MSRRDWSKARKHHGFEVLSRPKFDDYGNANGGKVKRFSREQIEQINAKREAIRSRESRNFSIEMARLHGAPDDCQLTPKDCVMLRQSIVGHGNVPPDWIVSASRSWLSANGLRESDLAPSGGAGAATPAGVSGP